MIHIESLEKHGVLAGMSDRDDGDCALNDDPKCRDNRVRVVQASGLHGTTLVGAQQVHGYRIAKVDRRHAGTGLTRTNAIVDTDALVTSEPEVVLTVTVADCVPLFLIDPVARVASLVHAGRVGTETDIAARTVVSIKSFGALPENIHACIGPSAGPCCYEVDAPMANQLRRVGLVVRDRHVDLWESNVRQLVDVGLARHQILVDGRCTICHGAFHSHRAHPDGQRNMAFLALT